MGDEEVLRPPLKVLSMTSRAMVLVSAAALAITALLCVSLIGVSGGFASPTHPGSQLNPAAEAVTSQLPVPAAGWHSAHPMGKAPLG